MLELAPERLWHYTDQQGLLGIIGSGQIWATDTAFLNDVSEVKYAMEKMKAALESRISKADFVAVSKMFEMAFEERRTGVVCFCANGDLLSQWRGYAAPGGYAIGFDPSALAERWLGEEGLFLPVEYGRETVQDSTERWADTVVAEWNAALGGDLAAKVGGRSEADIEELVDELAPLLQSFEGAVAHLFGMAPRFKDPAFSEENEWRLITPLHRAGRRIATRASPSGLVPYREVAYQGDPSNTPIRAVRIGPGSDVRQRTAVADLLRECGYQDVEVLMSELPFRG